MLAAVLCLTPVVFDRLVLPAAQGRFPSTAVPPHGVEAAESPLGKPPAVAPSDGYRLIEPSDPAQEMVAYDPCRPVRYVVRPDGAPAGSEALVEEAVAEVSAATGLRFRHDGPTGEAPSAERDAYQPGRYGRRWAPVLITWSDAGAVPDLAGDVAGLGGSAVQHVPGRPAVYVTGQVTLDAPDLQEELRHAGGRDRVRAVIMHELGHVVGLDHVDDPRQLMYPETGGVTAFAPGDRAGLARLGAGECVPQL